MHPNAALAVEIKQLARSLGFELCGIALAEPSRWRSYFRQWLDSGQAGAMEYLARTLEQRADPAAYLPGARSVVCVAMNYHAPLEPPTPALLARGGKVARYALGDDYHEVIKPRLHQLADFIRQRLPEAQTRACVDTAAVMEKELAARAGIGWLGKNTCIIHPEIGSWLFLGEVVTTAELPPDEPAIDRCGSCTRCIEACPTQAITAPYQLDATRCISYLTIELRDEIPEPLRRLVGNWMYGCDICQDVCPFNRRAPATTEPALRPRIGTGMLDARAVLHWSDAEFRTTFRNSAVRRVKLPILQRSARMVVENHARL